MPLCFRGKYVLPLLFVLLAGACKKDDKIPGGRSSQAGKKQ